MGGCYSSHQPTASPKRNGTLDKKQKEQQFWVDAQEIEDEEVGIYETKVKKSVKRISKVFDLQPKPLKQELQKESQETITKDKPVQKESIQNAIGETDDSEAKSDEIIPWDEYEKTKEENKPENCPLTKEEKIEIPNPANKFPSVEKQEKEQTSSKTIDKLEAVEGYAAMYSLKSESVTLIPWGEYEKNHLPIVIKERKNRETSKLTSKVISNEKNKKDDSSCTTQKSQQQLHNISTQLTNEKSRKPCEPFALVYEKETHSVKLISWEDYVSSYQQADRQYWTQSKHPQNHERISHVSKKSPPFAVVYEADNNSTKLIPWEEYEMRYQEKDLAVQKCKNQLNDKQKVVKIENKTPIAMSYTTKYDPIKQEVNLIPYESQPIEYKQEYAVVYNPIKQAVELTFWKLYVEKYSQLDTIVLKECDEKIQPFGGKKNRMQQELTTVYDPMNQEAVLISWDEYKTKNKLPKQDWTAVYNEQTKSTQLMYWGDYVKRCTAQNGQSEPTISIGRKTKFDFTTVYDKHSKEVRLQSWEEYVRSNKIPKQNWAVVYDETNQSTKLVFYTDLSPIKLPNKVDALLNTDYTVVYDEATESSRLVPWDDYLRTNKLPKQDWAVIYDEERQESKLTFYKNCQFHRGNAEVESQTSPMKVKETREENQEQQTGYAVLYDAENKSVKKIKWRDYELNHLPTYLQERKQSKTIYLQDTVISTEIMSEYLQPCIDPKQVSMELKQFEAY